MDIFSRETIMSARRFSPKDRDAILIEHRLRDEHYFFSTTECLQKLDWALDTVSEIETSLEDKCDTSPYLIINTFDEAMICLMYEAMQENFRNDKVSDTTIIQLYNFAEEHAKSDYTRNRGPYYFHTIVDLWNAITAFTNLLYNTYNIQKYKSNIEDVSASRNSLVIAYYKAMIAIYNQIANCVSSDDIREHCKEMIKTYESISSMRRDLYYPEANK